MPQMAKVAYASIFLNDTATTEISTLSLHDALPICDCGGRRTRSRGRGIGDGAGSKGRAHRSEEHTSELQSLRHRVCRLLLDKNKTYPPISEPLCGRSARPPPVGRHRAP